MRILMTELNWQEGIDYLVELGHTVEYDPTLWNKREELLQKVQITDAIIVRNQTKVDADLIGSAPNLKVVGRLGVGLDNIDLIAAKEKNLPVVFGKNANATSVAEYVVAAMMQVSRPLTLANADVRKGNWNRKEFTRYEVAGKTLGLIGLGEIAGRVAKRALALGMNVIAYDPFCIQYAYFADEMKIPLLTLEEVLAMAEFISIHVPLTPATRGMLSQAQFKQMKNTAYIINTSRGGIINETDLFNALETGEIQGAILDVLEKEPIQPDNILLQSEKVIITPHIAGLTEEAQIRTALLVSQEVNKVLNGQMSLCRV